MKARVARKVLKRIIIFTSALMVLFFAGIVILARFYVEPTLRKKLQTLIVDGSDSLYQYKLGNISTNLFGGNLTISDFDMTVDSSRYLTLKKANALPALVAKVNVKKANIKGISIFSLLFSKKIYISEIGSDQADINILRNFKKKDTTTAVTRNKQPLWLLLQPNIKDVAIDKIKLDGIRLFYRNNDDYDAAQFRFDRCDAVIDKIRIDSASFFDTSRIGYVENFSLHFRDLSFRSADSLYQMAANDIAYDSRNRYLEVQKFSLTPTLNKDQRVDSMRKSWYTVSFGKVSFNGLRLDRYLRQNRMEADSVVFQSPRLSIFQDKLGIKSYDSKIGKYPHQQLLNASAVVDIKKFAAHDMEVAIIERHEISREEGILKMDGLEIAVHNIVNDPDLIRRNAVATATAAGKILGSPVETSFKFYLDSAEGRFDAEGSLQNVTGAQITPLTSALANIQVPSANIEQLNFLVRANDFGATSDVRMRYNNLSIMFLKRDEVTGENTERGFLNKLLNKFAMYNSNPMNGTERQASNVKVARLTTQTFFGIIWQAVFAGMQTIILRSE